MGVIAPGKKCSVPFEFIEKGLVYLRPVTHFVSPDDDINSEERSIDNDSNMDEEQELREKMTSYKRDLHSAKNKNIKFIDESTQHIEYQWSHQGIDLQRLKPSKFHLSSPAADSINSGTEENSNGTQYQQSHQENTFYYTIWVEREEKEG